MASRGHRFLGDFISCLSATLVSTICAFADETATLSGKATVLDGDTLRIGVALVRLHGIDAPETGQLCERPNLPPLQCEEAATNRLVELVEGRLTICSLLESDPYGRLVATCEVSGIKLGPTLVKEGLAWAFTKYSQDYVSLELDARRFGLGVWQHGAEPQTPADYRADRWARAVAASPREGCPIKGNIARSGERIYHAPWSKYYARTKIDEAEGEKWFCDEAEAASAGWRPARSR